MSSGKKDYRTILPPKYLWVSPLFPSPSQLCCRLLFPAPTALHPQFPLGPSSCGSAFYKIKYSPIIQSGNCLPWHLLPEVENAGPHKNLHRDFYNSSIHNRQNLETTTISFRNRRLILCSKEMSYQIMTRHEGSINVWIKNAYKM